MFSAHRLVALLLLNGLAVGLLTLTAASASPESASTLPRRAFLPQLAADSAGGQQPRQACVLPPAGMVAWYPLDELTGASAVNDTAPPPSSTVNNVGTPKPGGQVGAPNGPGAVLGQVSGGLYFAGGYVEVPPQQELDFGTGDFTIDAWIKPVTIVDANFLSLIVYKIDANSGIGYALYSQGNQLGGRQLKLVMNGTIYASSPDITSSIWYHIAVRVDRANLSGDFYIDGQPAGSFVPIAGNITNTAPMLIGASFLSGLLLPNVGRHELSIDELELFNRALMPSEIQAIFNASSAGKCKDTQPSPDPVADLGDAPDSTNNASGSPQMTAYPGTQANFPTVFNSNPPGPRHLQPKAVAWLGPDVSFEVEADIGPDQDPSNNILPSLNQADKDLKDDGLGSPPALPTTFCSQITFTYSVSFPAVTTQPLYVNVWFDFTQDGDWQDSGKCAAGPATTGFFSEWAVQDQVIPPGSGPLPLTVTTPLFMAQRFDAATDVWMRITLSDQPAVDPDGPGPLQPDGRGPSGGFKYGETEDYLLVKSSPQLSEVCGIKFNDLNGNGVKDPGEPGLAGWTITLSPGSLTTTTGANGNYCFGPLSPGTYTVPEVQQVGWTPTTPPGGTITVTVPPSATNITFGNQKQTPTCDLAITKSVNPNPVRSGQQITITLTVTNVGTGPCPPGAFPGTIVRDNQPAGLAFTPGLVAASQPGWQCGFEIPTPNLTCATPNQLSSGYTVTFTFSGTTVTATPGSVIQNCATVTNQNDANPANNQSCVSIPVT